MRPLLVLAALLVALPAGAAVDLKVIVYGDSLWDGGLTGLGCDTCAFYPEHWNVFEYAVAGTEAWHQRFCNGAEVPDPDDDCENGSDVALYRAGYCPAAGNLFYPAPISPCLADNTDADVVLVQFGTNDVRGPDGIDVVWYPWELGDGTPTIFRLPEHLAGLDAILDQVVLQGQACLVITPPPVYDTRMVTANEYLENLRWLQLDEARAHGCLHLDLYQKYIDYEATYGEAAVLALYRNCSTKGLPTPPYDCIHYSEAGKAFAGRLIRDVIETDCDDGADNDGDGTIDYVAAGGGDPGCASPTAARENPQCQDGLNNDDATGIDFDGGASLDIDPRDGFIDAQFNTATPGVGAADPQCVGAPWSNKERPGCGLGFEVVLLAPLLARLTRKRRA